MTLPLRTVLALSLAAVAGVAQASLVSYTTQASFLAATAQTAVDTFAGIGSPGAVNYGLGRTIGSSGYSYHAYAPAAPGGYSSKSATSVAGSVANPSLSGYYYGVPLVLDTFQSTTGSPVLAIGGNFWDSNASLQAVNGSITLTALDIDGLSSVLTVTASRNGTTFLGFVSTTALQSLTIAPVAGTLATVDNLTLGTAKVTATVPEPATGPLVLAAAGAALVAGRLRRRGR